MENESVEPRKRGRGRPPGSTKPRARSKPSSRYPMRLPGKNTALGAFSHQSIVTSTKPTVDEEQHYASMALSADSSFADVLKDIITKNHTDITRIARTIDVTENTVYRWLNEASEPRIAHLQRLLQNFPQDQLQLRQAIRRTFHQEVEPSPMYVHEVQKEIYQRVLELAMTSQDRENRFWQIAQAVFAYALLHLDPEHLGLSITYARLMEPQSDGIHSLCEVITHGTSPWPFTEESKIFLGSTTLAGTAVMLQRLQVWNGESDNHIQTQVDTFERSACAIPIARDNAIAGVLILSSTKPDFFIDSAVSHRASEYALLMSVALSDQQFYPVSSIHLRPMPPLRWQREQVAEQYLDRVYTYARKHQTSRREAENYVQRELEREFEEEASTFLGQNHDGCE